MRMCVLILRLTTIRSHPHAGLMSEHSSLDPSPAFPQERNKSYLPFSLKPRTRASAGLSTSTHSPSTGSPPTPELDVLVPVVSRQHSSYPTADLGRPRCHSSMVIWSQDASFPMDLPALDTNLACLGPSPPDDSQGVKAHVRGSWTQGCVTSPRSSGSLSP